MKDQPEIDWRDYVRAVAAVHRLVLDASRETEVAEQLRRTHAMAQCLMDLPLPAETESASIFRL